MYVVCGIGVGLCEWLLVDVWWLLDKFFFDFGLFIVCVVVFLEWLLVLVGLLVENMGCIVSWCFFDLGCWLECVVGVCCLVKVFGVGDLSVDDLFLLFDLLLSVIFYC